MAGSSEITVTFPGGLQALAHLGHGHDVLTDQPAQYGGTDAAPAPYQLFLASLATCAGFFVVRFCRARQLPTEGLRLVQRTVDDPETKTLKHVELSIEVPPEFPEKYRDALTRVVEQCSVKKAIQAMPTFDVRVAGPVADAAGPLPQVAVAAA